jgi:hypothetical protein
MQLHGDHRQERLAQEAVMARHELVHVIQDNVPWKNPGGIVSPVEQTIKEGKRLLA